MRLTRNQVCRKVPGVRIPPSPPLSSSEEVKIEARLPVDVGNLSMNHENQFSVSRFRNRNGVFSFRVEGRLNGVRIRRNFKTLEDAATEKAALELKGLQLVSNLRSVTTVLAEEQVREAEAAFRRLDGNTRLTGLLPRFRPLDLPRASVPEVPFRGGRGLSWR